MDKAESGAEQAPSAASFHQMEEIKCVSVCDQAHWGTAGSVSHSRSPGQVTLCALTLCVLGINLSMAVLSLCGCCEVAGAGLLLGLGWVPKSVCCRERAGQKVWGTYFPSFQQAEVVPGLWTVILSRPSGPFPPSSPASFIRRS